MKNSGYNHKLREQVINAGTIAHREDIGRCKRGEKEDVPIQERKVRPEEIEPRKPKVMEEGESWSTRPHDVYKSSVHCRLKVVKKFQEVTRKHSFPIKFVKMSGHSLQNFGCIQKKRSVIVQSVSHVFQVEEGFSNWRFYRPLDGVYCSTN